MRSVTFAFLLACLAGCAVTEESGPEDAVPRVPRPPPPDLIEWVVIPGGDFDMGSPPHVGEFDEEPRHRVRVPTLEMMRAEVTNRQYRACVEAGACSWPVMDGQYCRFGYPEWDNNPVVCVNWFQAVEFCTWAGGRLPSEAEWEFAARSRGKDIEYPWGDDPPTCACAVVDEGAPGCGSFSTWPVCSKPAGNTEQGLCDMTGNVHEWLQDGQQWDYWDAPDDGSAWEDPPFEFRILRGGGIGSGDDYRIANRWFHDVEFQYGGLGIRCAR